MSSSATQTAKSRNAISITRDENFPEWYQEVIRSADMAVNAPVRGCMIIKPYGFAVWENVQTILGKMIKDQDVPNAYFPLLIPLEFISKEAEHIEGFAKECAVVTHHRLEKGPEGKLIPAAPLTEPYVIRPTSETIIGEALSNWIGSYRDLPYKLNQWCNVMRWEMRPRLFLRTTEFLWQEGHNCFATAEEAREDALKMLDVYVDFLENTMAIPVLKGEKTADERFPGAIATYTAEAIMQDGKAVQSCTSHDLGQTFSRGANIQYLGKDGQRHFAHTTSWGLSTRTIGALIMTHGDDDGAIMPPHIAPFQVAIIPVTRDPETDSQILARCEDIKKRLQTQGISVVVDTVDDKPSNKIWGAVKKGYPVRVELGGREVAAHQVTFARRDQKDSKKTISTDEFVNSIKATLADIQKSLFDRALAYQRRMSQDMSNLKQIRDFFAADTKGFVRMPAALLTDPEFTKLRTEFSVSPRCLPFADQGKTVVVGKSY